MNKNIKGIFESITPDNIRNVPAIRDAMEVFIETLEDLSKESIDVRAVYENDKMREYLVQTYLNDLYNVLKQVQLNEQVNKSIDRINGYYEQLSSINDPIEYIKKDAIDNISNYLTEEHFFTFRSYKQHKGTVEALKYIYELINGFVLSHTEDTDFRITEGEPFHLSMEGPLPAEFYEYIIYPLAHPLGFTYDYTRYIALKLEDFYSLHVTYNTNVLEVRCLFPDGMTKTTPFIDNTINGAEQEALGLDLGLKVIDIKEIREGTDQIRIVFLNNGTYLKQISDISGQTHVWHLEGTPENYSDNDTEVTAFAQQCSIYIDYTPVFNTTIREEKESEILSYNSEEFARLAPSNINDSLDIYDIELYWKNWPPSTLYSELEIRQDGDPIDIGFNIGESGYFIGGETSFDITDPENSVLGQELALIGGGIQVPSWKQDLKILEGKFTYLPLEYTETVEQPPTVTRVNSLEVYKSQNIGNSEYIAREHEYHDQYLNMTGGILSGVLIEPLHGSPSEYLLEIDAKDNENNPKLIGEEWLIGGFYDYEILETAVDADPVNLQYNTSDVIEIEDLGYLADQADLGNDDSPLEIIDEAGLNEPYGVYKDGAVIGDSSNDSLYLDGFFIGADEPFYYSETALQQTTTAVIDGSPGGFDIEELIISDDIYEHEEIVTTGGGAMIADSSDNLIGDNLVIDGQIVQTVGESYVGSEFNLNSDSQFEFKVYRDGVLLTDGNRSAA